MVLFVTQGLIYLDLELFATQGLFYLNMEFVGVSIKGIIFFNLELLKWRYGDQRSSLLQSSFVEMAIT